MTASGTTTTTSTDTAVLRVMLVMVSLNRRGGGRTSRFLFHVYHELRPLRRRIRTVVLRNLVRQLPVTTGNHVRLGLIDGDRKRRWSVVVLHQPSFWISSAAVRFFLVAVGAAQRRRRQHPLSGARTCQRTASTASAIFLLPVIFTSG